MWQFTRRSSGYSASEEITDNNAVTTCDDRDGNVGCTLSGKKRKRAADSPAPPVFDGNNSTVVGSGVERTAATSASATASVATSESGRSRRGGVRTKSRRAVETDGDASNDESDG